MNYRQKRQDKIAREIQKEYTALSQLQKERELGTLCVEYGITKKDLFRIIEAKRMEGIEDEQRESESTDQ
ncbi:hypothetical protein [Faecalicoccus pleomorphus]|uniref:hypothetical protein n=1 Tax=Faecalicoccus pleomorphus TaxID=1323 RepID=UPI0022E02885|nr:hypothetical protein [Faecalicoccus pleomorphus]